MNIIYWCEFPQKINWKKLRRVLEDLRYEIKIYVTCSNLPQYRWWEREIKKNVPNIVEVNAWPITEKKEGYWFSGFTSKSKINNLNQFNETKMKIDLELPPLEYDYSFLKLVKYFGHYLFKKAPNTNQLNKEISKLSKKSQIIINEFPLPNFLLKKWGCYYPKQKNVKKNIMLYPTICPRWYFKLFSWLAYKKDNDISISIGLIGTGILNNEPVYKNVKSMKKDLDFLKNVGINNVAIYSIDSIIKRKKPKSWFKILQKFSQS